MAGGAAATEYPKYIRHMHLLAYNSQTSDDGKDMDIDINRNKSMMALWQADPIKTNPFFNEGLTTELVEDDIYNVRPEIEHYDPKDLIEAMQKLYTESEEGEDLVLKTPEALMDSTALESVRTQLANFKSLVTQDVTNQIRSVLNKAGDNAINKSQFNADILFNRMSTKVCTEIQDNLSGNINNFIEKYMENTEDINPIDTVKDIYEEIMDISKEYVESKIASFKRTVFLNLSEYKEQIASEVEAFEDSIAKRQQRAIGRTMATLGKNGIYTGTAMANAAIEHEEEGIREINKYELDLINKLRELLASIFVGVDKSQEGMVGLYTTKTQVDAQQYITKLTTATSSYVQIYLETFNKYLQSVQVQLTEFMELYKSGLTTALEFERYKVLVNDKHVTSVLSSLIQAKDADINRVEEAKKMATEMHKLSIIAYGEYYDKRYEQQVSARNWLWTRFQNMQNFIAAPAGISPVSVQPSRLQTALGNASTGAMLGAKLGTTIAGGNPIGTAIGAALGVAAGAGVAYAE
jgi:hypothetical protein